VEKGGRKNYGGRPRNRWQNEVKENGRIVVEGWKEKVHNREEWKKILRIESSHSAHANGMNENE
jgi:hypothetical protein